MRFSNQILTCGVHTLITKTHDTLLHMAASNGALQCLEYLLPLLPQHINSHNKYGHSPLMRAIIKKRLSCIKFLLQNNADVHIQDKHGQTALHFVASKNCPEIVTLLVQCGADPNCICNRLYTPLHCAAHYRDVQAMTILLEHGADSSLETQSGKTALELFVQSSIFMIVVRSF